MILRSLALALLLGLLTGCGKHYWEARASDRGLSAFMDNSAHCIGEAKAAKYGIGAEEIYRACMKTHGWRRVQTAYPNDQQFRGPEDTDEFAAPPDPLSERGPSPAGRPDDPACAAGPTASRPQHCPRR